MTTLADINATLGAQNLALAQVVSTQKQTNTGIDAFLKHIKSTDARDRRETKENEREEKKASVVQRIGGYASATGGALANAGRRGLAAGKGAMGFVSRLLPTAALASFINALGSSKLFRAGLAGLGFFMGDQIADFLVGPQGSEQLKKQLGGAIKGGAIGSLLGPRFALLGAAIGGLLADDKIDTELGKLTKNINELVIKLGVKDGLAGLLSKITSGIGIGLESLNNLLKGDINIDNVTNGLMMIGGVASLLMPGRMLGLAFKAAKLLALTPAGRALLFVAGGAKLISDLLADPKKGDARFLTGPEGDIDYAGQQEKIAAGDTEGPGSGPMSTFDMVSNSLLAAYGLKKGFDFVKYMKNLKKPGVKGSPQLDLFDDAKKGKNPRNMFSRIMNVVKSGGRHAMTMVRGLPVLLPLAAVAGLTYVLNNKESSEDLKRKTNANKIKGIMTPDGIKAGINITGGGGMEMDIPDGTILSDSPAYKKKFSNSFFAKPVPQAPTLSDYFTRNRLTDGASPGAMGGVIVDNSNSGNITNNQNTAALFGNAVQVGHDVGDQLKSDFNRLAFQGF